MIDFRYHIVSLIAVFLALAVGIALGAGPLRGTIGAQLTEQVAQLRAEKDELRVQLDAQSAQTDQRGRYIEASAEELLTNALPRGVAVVTLPGADEDVVGAVIERLSQAGATVTSRLAVTPAWTDPDQQSFRTSLVGSVSGYLSPAPNPEDSSDAVLGRALATALTAGTAAGGAPSEEAGLILEVLTSGQLVAVTTAPSRTADAVVVIAPRAEESSQEAVAALVALAAALAGESEGVVVGGPATANDDLVVAVRAGDAGERVATVDGVDGVTGQVSLPRALARAVAGEVGHYGFAGSADAVLPPRVQLPAGTA